MKTIFHFWYAIMLIVFFAPMAFAGQGGPDAYGYTWKDSNEPGGPTFNWINITTTGTQVTGLGDDNFVGPFGFIDGFQYYWYYPTQVWIGSNGYLSFSGNNFASPFPTIPNTTSPHNFIAAMMSDLNFDGTGNPGTCYYRNSADTIVVSWINVPFWTNGTPSYIGSNSFQIVLVRSDRSITFNYQTQLGSTQGGDITVGIENINGQLGLLHSKNVYPPTGYSIKFYYPATTSYQAVDGGVHWNMDEDNGGVFVKRNSSVPVVTNVKNFGNQPLTNINVSATISHPTAMGMSGTGQIAGIVAGTDTSYTFNTPLIPTDAGIYNMISQVGGIAGDLVASNNLLSTKIIAIDTAGTQIPMEYHDGTPDLGGISWSGGNGGVGYYMRPVFYPCRINGYRLMIASDPMANGCYLKIFDDDGPNGSPGTMLDSVYASPSSYVVGVNSLIPTAGSAINIPSGGFYVLWVMPPGGSVALARDATPPISNRSYEYLGGTWAPCRFRFTEDYFLGVTVNNGQTVNIGQSVTASRILDACLGDTTSVTISHPTLTGVANSSLRMTYNPDSLTYVGFNSLNPAFSGMTISGGNGVVLMNWGVATNQTIAAGNMVNLRFRVNGSSTVAWDTLTSCEFSDENLNLVPQTFVSGSITQNTKNFTWNRSICEGLSFSLSGQSYSTSGTYQGRLTGTGGACDTLITLNLNVIPRQTILPAVTRCSNQPYPFNGLSLTSSGTYYDTLINSLGCDSILQLNLTVNPSYNQNQNIVICSGTSFAFGGQNLTTSGNYSHTYTTVNGCDSLVNLTFNFAGTGNQVTIQASSNTNGFCPGTGIRIGLPNPIPNAFYRWKLNGNILAGASSDTLYATQAGDYQVEIEVSPTCTLVSNTLTITVLNCNRVTGDLRYDNTNQTPLAGVPVHLKTLLGNIVASDTTDSAGVYDMAGYANGNYLLDASVNYTWGGVTSADALLVTRVFNALISMNALRLKAGDVNMNNSTNGSDALIISRRVTGVINSFGAGNFTNNLPSLNALGNPLVANLRVLSTGDVNGSYTALPTAPTLVLDTVIGGPSSGTATVRFTTSGSGVFERGICWSTSPNPTVSGNKMVVGSGGYGFTQVFSGSMVGNQLNYARAYARTSSGIFYSNEKTFTTAPGQPCPGVSTVTDIDGNIYQGIQIGTQCWTQSNLKVSKYRNGDSIPTGLSNIAWQNTTSGAYAIYNNDPVNDGLYGKLYNYYAVTDIRGLCPTGWHVPSDGEWVTLQNHLGGAVLAGGALKSPAIQPTPGGWNPPNNGATNSSGFIALPGGRRLDNGGLDGIALQGNWWSSSNVSSVSRAWSRLLNSQSSNLFVDGNEFTYGFSVRCLKNSLPQVRTNWATNITTTTALVLGDVYSDGGNQNVSRGFCYSTTSSPTISNDTVLNGTGLGVYSDTLRGLTPSTTFYIRAYATNTMGTTYGNELSFATDSLPGLRCPGTHTVTDVDGNVYATVQIGNQCWMQSNLQVSKYRNGDSIATDLSSSGWSSTTTGAYAWYPIIFNYPAFGPYGKLYNHFAVTDSRGLCPTGWHVPSDAEWNTLENDLGGSSVAGGALKSTATQPTSGGWYIPNAGATNYSGFTALSGGLRRDNGVLNEIAASGYWWSSSVSFGRSLNYQNASIIRISYNPTFGLSVRCLKD